MFLKHFAGDVPWCHLDIAGTAWDVTEKAHIGPGGTGVGVRLITQLLREWAGPPQSG
jgi:leucyl aminopeptidase